MGLFGKSKERPPKELVQEWNSKLRKEGYGLDRQIKSIQREEEKVKRSMKDAAKRGETDACRILAKEVINSRKAVKKIYVAKAQINSVQLQMKNQLATLRLAGALEKSTQVMQSMQQLIKLPEIQATMYEMSKEMTKAGIIEEMLDDTMESVMDDEDMEEEVEDEVEKILFEITAGAIGKAPDAVTDTIVPSAEEEEKEAQGATGGAEEEDMQDMQARLEALRS